MRILCVDDDPFILGILCGMLDNLGHDVIAAECGEHALRRVARSGMSLDLLITDIRMPGGVDGREVGRLARQARPDLPIIYFTGDTDIADLNDGDRLLRKPCTLGMLEGAIRDIRAASPDDRNRAAAMPGNSLIGRSSLQRTSATSAAIPDRVSHAR